MAQPLRHTGKRRRIGVDMNDIAPRLRTGARMHLVETPACAVVMDNSGREVSDREPGRVWLALSAPDRWHIIFDPDSAPVDMRSELSIKRPGDGCLVAIMLGDEVASTLGYPTRVWSGDVYKVHWRDGYDLMA